MPDDVAPDGTTDKQHSQGRGVGISCGHVVGDHVHIRTEDASGLGGEPRHQAVAPVRGMHHDSALCAQARLDEVQLP